MTPRPLEELRFGTKRTLNLREGLPTKDEAVRRADAWLRQHQVLGSDEVLVITGRGNQSTQGVPVIKLAIEKLLHALRRQGVVASFAEHTAGSFVAILAPIRSMVDAPRRRKDQKARPAVPATLAGLQPGSVQLLRELAERSLDALGVLATDPRIEDEMHRQLRAIIPSLGSDRGEEALQATLRAALAEYD